MTALAAFFALMPMALGLARGSEANTPLGRAVIGGLLAGLVTTLFVVPALYSLVVRDRKKPSAPEAKGESPGTADGPDGEVEEERGETAAEEDLEEPGDEAIVPAPGS